MSKKVNYTKNSLHCKYVSLNGYKKVQVGKGENELIIKDDGLQDVYWARETDPNYLKAVSDYEENAELYAKSFHPNYMNMTHPKDVSLDTFVSFYTKDWKPSKQEAMAVFSPFFRHGPPKAKKIEAYESYSRARVRMKLHFLINT